MVSGAGVGYQLSLPESFVFGYASYGWCPGREVSDEVSQRLWAAVEWLPVLWYAGVPAVVLAFAAHWSSARLGRPRAGRVVSRVLAGALLLLYGLDLVAFGVDLALDRSCLEQWGGVEGLRFFLGPDVMPTVAAFCVLAAVRIPKYRVRRVLLSRWFRRGLASVAGLGLLSFLPAGDFSPGPTGTEACEFPQGAEVATGERAFLCGMRRDRMFTMVGDHLALAYGRRMCAAFPHPDIPAYRIAAICPPAAAVVRQEREAEEAAYQADVAAEQKACDEARHRPRIKPLRVVRDRMYTDYGVIESFEAAPDDDTDPFQDGLLDKAQHHGLVATLPGHFMMLSHSDYANCLTAETYRRRPPVEVKGWDRVVEVGYESPAGSIVLMDPMAGEGLPNLAFRGKGHYRIRVHYREPDWEAWTPQHILVMVFPGRGDQVVEHRRPS